MRDDFREILCRFIIRSLHRRQVTLPRVTFQIILSCGRKYHLGYLQQEAAQCILVAQVNRQA